MTEETTSIQEQIEQAMRQFHDEERWDSIYLFSSEGLLMASQVAIPGDQEEKLLEYAFTLMDTLRQMDKTFPALEIVLKGKRRSNLVFRYFDAWGEDLVLAAVLPGRKGYKRAMNRLITLIRNLE